MTTWLSSGCLRVEPLVATEFPWGLHSKWSKHPVLVISTIAPWMVSCRPTGEDWREDGWEHSVDFSLGNLYANYCIKKHLWRLYCVPHPDYELWEAYRRTLVKLMRSMKCLNWTDEGKILKNSEGITGNRDYDRRAWLGCGLVCTVFSGMHEALCRTLTFTT